MDEYNKPEGQMFILVFVFISQVFLISFLIGMFVLRYFHVWKNIEATRRMDIIKLKNTQCYDKHFGAITMTYFPINIILLPFIPALILMKSERLNNTIL